MLTCDVCGKAEALGVASSGLGAISFAYCRDCSAAGAEPWDAIVATVWTCGGDPAALADWARESVDASLKVHGKTWDDLRAACREVSADYEQYMAGEREMPG